MLITKMFIGSAGFVQVAKIISVPAGIPWLPDACFDGDGFRLPALFEKGWFSVIPCKQWRPNRQEAMVKEQEMEVGVGRLWFQVVSQHVWMIHTALQR